MLQFRSLFIVTFSDNYYSKNVKTFKRKIRRKKKVKWINPLKDRTRVVPFIVPNHE